MRIGIIELLRADGSIVVNKRLAKALGLHEAIIYSELLSRYCYFADRGRLDAGGYFYNTIEDLQAGTTLSRRQQDKAIGNLVKAGLVKTKLFGMPAKRHFKIIVDNEIGLLKILDGSAEKEKAQLRQIGRTFIEACQKQGADPEVTPELEEDIGRQLEEASAEAKEKKKKWAYAGVE